MRPRWGRAPNNCTTFWKILVGLRYPPALTTHKTEANALVDSSDDKTELLVRVAEPCAELITPHFIHAFTE
jgi:hypothetical protein